MCFGSVLRRILPGFVFALVVRAKIISHIDASSHSSNSFLVCVQLASYLDDVDDTPASAC